MAVSKALLILSIGLIIPFGTAMAGERKVKASDIRSVNLSVGGKGYKVACLKSTPGKTRKVKKQLYFLSYKDESSALSKKKKKSSSDKKRIGVLKVLQKDGKTSCTVVVSSPSGPHLSLAKFDGSFGREEALILYNRFAFGATPGQLDEAVRVGLDTTVDRMLTYNIEPVIEGIVKDVECDNWRLDDPEAGDANRTCSTVNVNDFSRTGLRNSLLYRFFNSWNGFFHRFAFFLMDERLAVSQSAARDCEKHAIKTYVDSIYKAAIFGDYREYMRDMNSDHLMHIRWLDGGTNRGGLAVTPNENYAREFWELGTVAPADLSGRPVYSDLDIANGALAFTGWNIDELNVNGNYTCLASWIPLFHTEGPKTVFGGTPYQSTVTNADDLLAATFVHPRAAEHLAEDLWKEYVNPFATSREIRELAQVIRDNNFNLLPVFKKLMLSKAVYASQSRNSLIKHPLDMAIGFVKTTGFPLYYRDYDGLMSRLEEQVLNPNTVFGWDLKYLSGQQLQIEWWNALIDYFINVDPEDLKKEQNFSYYDRFVRNLHNAGKRTAADVVDYVSKELGVPINAAERAELEQMMNNRLTTSGCPNQCGGNSYRLIRAIFDTDPNADESKDEWNGQRRLRMLITALLELPAARTK